MSRRLKIPWLVESVTVDRLADAGEINAHPSVTRGQSWQASHAGPLINRWRLRRIADVMEVDGQLLPVFLARDDNDRAEEQSELEHKLSGMVAAGTAWRDEDIAGLAGLLREGAGERDVGIAVQGLLGRIFVPDYKADRESYRAARTVGEWPRAGLLKALWWRLTGKVWRARAVVWKRAGEDRLCIHATCIGLHNIVDSLMLLGRLHADPVTRGRMAEDRVVGQCLQAPESLLRRCDKGFYPGFLGKRIGKHALIVLDMTRLHAGSADTRRAFAVGDWNQCPAHRFVPALLIAVWRALDAGESEPAREAAE